MHAEPHPLHVDAFDALAAHIREVSGGSQLLFCPSPGNWGDSIINAGTRSFFSKYGFDYVEKRREDVAGFCGLAQAHLVVGGGGGWCEQWHTTPEFVEEMSGKARHVTVLPTTFGVPPKEPVLDSNVFLFARDASYSLAQQPRASFCHDMAFHYRSAHASASDARSQHLDAFRTDREAKVGSISAERAQAHGTNRDLSLDGNGYMSPDGLYAELLAFRTLDTDRLHLGIAGAQLGLGVRLFPSAYPKVESVFSSSIAEAFPNVELVTDE